METINFSDIFCCAGAQRDGKQIDVQKIYSRLGDALSQRIFSARVMYSLTGDGSFLRDCIRLTEEGQEFLQRLESIKAEGREIAVYGAGRCGISIYDAYQEYIDFFVDQTAFRAVPALNPEGLALWRNVRSPDTLKDHKTAFIIVAFGGDEKGKRNTQVIHRQLIELGFAERQILDYYPYFERFREKIYFDLPALTWNNGDTFVDCGSFDGYNAQNYVKVFRKHCPGGKANLIALEANTVMAEKINTKLKSLEGLGCHEVVSAVAWSSSGRVQVRESAGGMVEVTEDSNGELNSVTIDEVLGSRRADFIKMDIEGSEYQALLGAQKTIRRDKPQLAISVYHKLQDIVALPALLLSILPTYQFYLRHYSIKSDDTVLYAISESV